MYGSAWQSTWRLQMDGSSRMLLIPIADQHGPLLGEDSVWEVLPNQTSDSLHSDMVSCESSRESLWGQRLCTSCQIVSSLFPLAHQATITE